jgi:hypothetical protein
MEAGPNTSASAGSIRGLPWILAAVVVIVVLVLSALVLLAGRWFPGAADCTATLRTRTVELSTEQAQTAASIGARAVRLRLPLRRVSDAVADVLDLSGGDARVVARALTGRTPHAFTCLHGGADQGESGRLDRAGLTHRAEVVRHDLVRAFGPLQVGGFAPGGVTSGHMPGSAHYEGRAVDVFFRPINHRHRTRGWAMAQYLVAHAERLKIDTVIFDGHIWTARRAGEGWRRYQPDTSGRSAQVAAILEHRDHVHVDVAD